MLGQKNVGPKIFLGQQNFGPKIFWVKKIFGQKMFWAKKNLGSKNIFGQKDLGLKFFLSKKNQEGLTESGGYMTPPPKKIVGLKFCWGVLSCPKRFL